MSPWQGKWALVTGASAGIGAELARQLAAGGANLVLTARRTERLERLATELGQKHQIQTEIVSADLTQRKGAQEIFDFTQGRNLPIEILINNAGFGAAGAFRTLDLQRQLDMVQVNVSSVIHLTHLYLPAMVERHSGYIMIVASTAAFQSVPYLCVYGATKGFDLLFAEGIAEELRDTGVRVSALCPGGTVSEFQEVAGTQERRGRAPVDKVVRDGLSALAEGRSMVISGFGNWFGMEAQRVVPRRVVTRAVAKLYRPGR